MDSSTRCMEVKYHENDLCIAYPGLEITECKNFGHSNDGQRLCGHKYKIRRCTSKDYFSFALSPSAISMNTPDTNHRRPRSQRKYPPKLGDAANSGGMATSVTNNPGTNSLNAKGTARSEVFSCSSGSSMFDR